MANPKLENGYTRIAHELLEQFALADFSGAEFKILIAIIRQTYGFQRKSAAISIAQISTMCDLHITTASKTLKRLMEKKVVIEKASPGFAKSREMSINKNHAQWLVKRPTVGQIATVSQTTTPTVGQTTNKGIGQTTNNTKDIYKHTIKNRESSPSLELINEFSKEKGLDSSIAEKFFKYYESRNWKTNGGTDVAAVWRDKLIEWNKNEVRKNEKTVNTFSGKWSGDYEAVERMLNSDD